MKKHLIFTILLGAICLFSHEASTKAIKEIKKPWAAQSHSAQKLPIVYHPQYNISLWNLEKCASLLRLGHPFDGAKYGKIAHHLCNAFGITEAAFHLPHKVAEADLQKVHTTEYLASLNSSSVVARIAEVPVAWLPNSIVQWKILDPMRYATQGTIDAARIALQEGIGINLSGGYHHARSDEQYGGFCFFADIPLAIHTIREEQPTCQRILIVDLDAHRGNGIAQVRGDDQNTFIFDMFSYPNYPFDYDTKCLRDTDTVIPLAPGVSEEAYLTTLIKQLGKTIDSVKPDLIIFNAGSDIYAGDQLGCMQVSAEGIQKRDEHVFDTARSKNIPIVMTLSGGYSKESGGIVGKSIENILRKHCAHLIKNNDTMQISR